MTGRGAVESQVHHPFFARLWSRLAPALDQRGGAQHRQRMLAGITGRVVEVGAGTGANFRYYLAGVTEVLAVEPEAGLRAAAEQAARRAAVPVEVVDGLAERIPADDGVFDAAVVSLVLCSVPDQRAALRELRRVLRPGGRLHFWEHVRGEGSGLPRVQDALDRTVWPALAGGCHTGRDTAAALAAAGFTVERMERFRFPDRRLPSPIAPQILGTALREG